MTRARTARMLTVALAATGLFAASQALAVPVEDQSRFFLRQDACDTAGYLSTVSGEDGADGCSWYGLPLDEVFYQAEGAVLLPLTYTTSDGVPLVLDSDRTAAGVVSTRGLLDPVGGVGEVVVDVQLEGVYLDGTRRTNMVLGSGTFSETAMPTAATTAVPFELALPAAADGLTFTSLTLTANIRGTNVAASGQGLSGSSWVDVPTTVDDGTEAPAA